MREPRITHERQAALEITELKAWYGDSPALFGVNLRIMPGEVVGLVGRNGAGKTTILRAVMGLLVRQTGGVSLQGCNANMLRPSERARLGVGYCPEERAIFASLTVSENLALPPVVAADAMSEEEILSLFPNLKGRLRQLGGQLSGGEQQMLAIGRILRTGARTLLLDEPTEGLAPIIVRQIENALMTLKGRGYTILLVEQNLAFVLRLADRVVAIEHGTDVAQCDAADPAQAERRLARHLSM